MRILFHNWQRLLCVGFASLVLQACSSDNDATPVTPPPPPAMASFDVSVTNLTNAQPLSPVAVVAHRSDYSMFTIGTAATVGLEMLAEGGDNSTLLAEADASAVTTASGTAPIGPAGAETVTVTVLESELPGLAISVGTMLVNTNDAISGINAADVSDMLEGDVWMGHGIVYDAGTEANSELTTAIPGPAGGGEGFNAARDDRFDRVAMHAGIIGFDDGLATSGLSGQHRFDNPAVQVRIERTD